MNNRITYIGLYAFSLYSLIMSLIFGIVVLLLVMLIMTLYIYCREVRFDYWGPWIRIVKLLVAQFIAARFTLNKTEVPAWVVKELSQIDHKLFNLEILYKNAIRETLLMRFYKIVWQLYLFVVNKKENVMFTSNTNLEIAWTLLPIFILVIIMLPSLVLLYAMDDVSIAFGNITIKVIGHQWYWTYQHINMSPQLMPVYFEINKQVFLNTSWLASITKI